MFEPAFGESYKRNKDLTIYCNPGSMALKFAREHNIQVKAYDAFDELTK